MLSNIKYKIRIYIKKKLLFFLNTTDFQEKFTAYGSSFGIKNIEFEGKNAVAERSSFSGKIKVGLCTTLGISNYLHGNIIIGKYCQFGAYVAIHSSNHPVNFMSTYINKNLFDGALYTLKKQHKVIVGNDVWIGHNVTILGDVTIGNGAIIAAGAVVTKDVAPYSIVAGVPAKVIKMRFSDTIIKEIESLKWWDLPANELDKIKPLFMKDFTNLASIYE